MNKLQINTLKALRKTYTLLSGKKQEKPLCEQNPDKATQIIIDALIAENPCMIARFGSTELNCLMNYMGVKHHKNELHNYIQGKTPPWWWEQGIINQMQQWSGFFPPTVDTIEQFCEMMLVDMKEVDVLGSWLESEKYFEQELNYVKKVHLRLLEPFWSEIPWTKALENKKVLVVHPFAEDIESQYQKRLLLFKKEILPECELKTLKAVQSIAGEETKFTNWFEALDFMKSEIDKTDYDVCIIGAGAYGFHLAAHVKRSGKKAIHLGGATQLLFGIKGKRWEDPNYGVNEWGIPQGSYTTLINEYWIKPNKSVRPKGAELVEGGCYW